jgi:hypothetical protein
MSSACDSSHSPQRSAQDKPHPFVGRIAVGAIVLSMLAIVWAKIEVLGTRDIERTLTEEGATLGQKCVDRLEAVAFNRWATGFSP